VFDNLDKLNRPWYHKAMISDLKELENQIKGLLRFIMPSELKRSVQTRIIGGDVAEVRVIIEIVKPSPKKWYHKIIKF